MTDLKLHEINESLSKLGLLLENEADIAPYLDGVKLQQEEKAKALFSFMKKYDDNNDAISKEIKRLQDLKKTYTNHYSKIKNYISYAMGANNIDTIETDLVRFSFRKSSNVEIEDETKLPKEYFKEKVTVSVDKIKLGKDLKAGEQVPGAFLKANKLLQIK